MTLQELEPIAQRAAAIYGVAWGDVPAHSREIWIEAVRTVNPSGVTGVPLYDCAAQAVRESLTAAVVKNAKTSVAPAPKEEAKGQVVKEAPKGKGK